MKAIWWLAALMVLAGCVGEGDFSELVPDTVVDDPTLPAFETPDGVQLHLQRMGPEDGPTVVVLHGGPGGDFVGLLALQELKDTHQVIFFDQRGSGLSERLDPSYITPDEMVADIRAIQQAYSPEEPIALVGHSWGGALATHYVQHYPDEVASLVLAEPAALNATAAAVANTTEFRFRSRELHQMLNSADYLSYDNHHIADYQMAVSLSSDVGDYRDFYSPDELKELAFARFGFMANYAINDWQGNFDDSWDYDFADGVRQDFSGDVLLLAADHSERLGPDFQRQYHLPLLPESTQFVEIAEAGHFFLEFNADQALPEIRAFLDGEEP